MKVNFGGVVPLSTLDWTGVSSAVIFMRGCPLRCPHCHNAHLQSGEELEDIERIKNKIDEAEPFISALILSGGEPLIQLDACRAISSHAKEKGLLVGVETSGYYPDRLASLIDDGLIDIVFLDVKEELKDPEYERATGRKGVAPRVAESLRLCLEAKVPLEVRTTVFPNMPSIDGLLEIAELLRELGIGAITLQQGLPSEGERPFDPVPIKLLTIAAQTMKELRGIDATVKKGPLPSRSSPYQTELSQICQLRKPHPVMRIDPKIEDQDHKTGDQSWRS
ncbi:anaerobic ribonucleoside-triphosphate reductase activating protein [Candidatus Methanocrinis natronophilus]|uniref:Anaerobic ribonucleoside-triphosphate reductase activating protein n=1 Tax=Candidatus Methanocrinis natronophilus TaxID=3033396 RepID=A0ABT5X8M2_9EURY|nr:anaerobic ribonucleoside-triphosphate reductase activating protein [Candidatus Methanocrinis natronophilus]MDF0591036.1 anaerobic ribonucleoside-triphosphate reductase activating protein [Candidatus Methanocrinis natronophilus]